MLIFFFPRMQKNKNSSFLNYFPKNSEPRQAQINALNEIERAWESKKYVIACLPTGIGKSHIAASIASSSKEIDDERKHDISSYGLYKMDSYGSYTYDEKYKNKENYGSYILTITKSLQDQYQQIFSDFHIFKGKGNYQCQVDLSQTADFAPCLYSRKIKEKCFDSCICPYYEAKNKAIYTNVSILNYRSFFNLRPFLQKRQYFICDEADGIEEEIVSQFTLDINYSLLKGCGINFKKIKEDNLEKAKLWLMDIYSQIDDELENLKKKSFNTSKKEGLVDLQSKIIQQISRLSKLHSSFKRVIEYWDDCGYLIEEMKSDKIVFVPYNIKPLFNNIFGSAEKVLLMSATISNHKQFAKTMGISENEYHYIELPSPFDPKKSPIYCSNVFNLSYKNNNKDLENILNACLELCKKHKDYKGIIHTHTNIITKKLYSMTNGDSRFLFKMDVVSNEDILKLHKETKEPTILVSPSLDTGISLDGNLGRFQIVLKAPFLPLSSKRIKKKFDTDSDQYMCYMLNTLVQMSGRCTRSKDDYSVTYILDGNATKAIKKYNNILPKHFLNRIH
jgi:ATP-dependent DNA helicase DinG